MIFFATLHMTNKQKKKFKSNNTVVSCSRFKEWLLIKRIKKIVDYLALPFSFSICKLKLTEVGGRAYTLHILIFYIFFYFCLLITAMFIAVPPILGKESTLQHVFLKIVYYRFWASKWDRLAIKSCQIFVCTTFFYLI